MSESDKDIDLDPRIQIELEKLNITTDEINKLEIEYDEANTTFQILLNDSTRRLKLLADKLGSCIEKSRPYYELLEEAKKAQRDCQEITALYKKANGIHLAAKETVALAEQRFLTHKNEWQFDNAWQEMLNHATIKVMEAENQKTEYGREHQRRAQICKQIEDNLKQFEEKLHKTVSKARTYFEEKALCQEQLNTQKQRIETLKQDIIKAKNFYSQTLKNLEHISNEIHQKRGTKPEDDILKHPREPGVGAPQQEQFDEETVKKTDGWDKGIQNIQSDTEKLSIRSDENTDCLTNKNENKDFIESSQYTESKEGTKY